MCFLRILVKSTPTLSVMKKLGTRQLETPRLILRKFQPEDYLEVFNNWANNPQVTQWLRWEPHKSPEETKPLVEEWATQQDPYKFHWVVQRKQDGRLIGSIGCFPPTEQDLAGMPFGMEPGYCFGQEFWGQGFATEALLAVVDFMANQADVDTLYSCYAIDNPASGKVLEHAGFTFLKQGQYYKLDHTPIPANYVQWKRKDMNGR